jgi:hypothetical protein
MYVQRNNERGSRNHVCRGKATSMTYFECVFVALVIQQATGMRCTILSLWPVSFHYIFPHYIINGTNFG